MGMFDHVKYSAPCPLCGQILTDWQSQNGDCLLLHLEPWQVENFYTTCPGCKARVEAQVDADIEHIVKRLDIKIEATSRAELDARIADYDKSLLPKKYYTFHGAEKIEVEASSPAEAYRALKPKKSEGEFPVWEESGAQVVFPVLKSLPKDFPLKRVERKTGEVPEWIKKMAAESTGKVLSLDEIRALLSKCDSLSEEIIKERHGDEPAPPPAAEDFPLAGSVLHCDDPTGPVADHDWEAVEFLGEISRMLGRWTRELEWRTRRLLRGARVPVSGQMDEEEEVREKNVKKLQALLDEWSKKPVDKETEEITKRLSDKRSEKES